MQTKGLLNRAARAVLVGYLRRTSQSVEWPQCQLGFNQRDRRVARSFVSGILRPFHGCHVVPLKVACTWAFGAGIVVK